MRQVTHLNRVFRNLTEGDDVDQISPATRIGSLKEVLDIFLSIEESLDRIATALETKG